MDVRIVEFLTEKKSIKIAHREIAEELDTARKAVSRSIKKLEK